MKFLSKEKLSRHMHIDNSGYLICENAVLARTGKQQYRHNELYQDSDDDSIIDIDRPEKEVFNDKTLASFENKPICDEHPDVDVTPENYNELSVGYVRDVHKGIDNGQPVMMGTLVITDADAIEAVKSGKRQLSCGYDCDLEDGINGMYQANIRGNHVALCEEGRAGIARIVDSKVEDDDIRDYHYYIKKLRQSKDRDEADKILDEAWDNLSREEYFKLEKWTNANVDDSKVNDSIVSFTYRGNQKGYTTTRELNNVESVDDYIWFTDDKSTIKNDEVKFGWSLPVYEIDKINNSYIMDLIKKNKEKYNDSIVDSKVFFMPAGSKLDFINYCDYGRDYPLVEGVKTYTFKKDCKFFTKAEIRNYVEDELTAKYNADKRTGWEIYNWNDLNKFKVDDSKTVNDSKMTDEYVTVPRNKVNIDEAICYDGTDGVEVYEDERGDIHFNGDKNTLKRIFKELGISEYIKDSVMNDADKIQCGRYTFEKISKPLDCGINSDIPAGMYVCFETTNSREAEKILREAVKAGYKPFRKSCGGPYDNKTLIYFDAKDKSTEKLIAKYAIGSSITFQRNIDKYYVELYKLKEGSYEEKTYTIFDYEYVEGEIRYHTKVDTKEVMKKARSEKTQTYSSKSYESNKSIEKILTDKNNKIIKNNLKVVNKEIVLDSVNDSYDAGVDWLIALDEADIKYTYINGGYGMQFRSKIDYDKAKKLAKEVRMTNGQWYDKDLEYWDTKSTRISNDDSKTTDSFLLSGITAKGYIYYQLLNGDFEFYKDGKLVKTVKQSDIVKMPGTNKVQTYVEKFLDSANDSKMNDFKEPISSFKTWSYKDKSKQGFTIMKMYRDMSDDRLHVILKRGTNDFIVALGYSPDDGTWNQGVYELESLWEAEDYLNKHYNVKRYIHGYDSIADRRSTGNLNGMFRWWLGAFRPNLDGTIEIRQDDEKEFLEECKKRDYFNLLQRLSSTHEGWSRFNVVDSKMKDKMIPPTQQCLNDVEAAFKKLGWVIESQGPSISGNVHYQIQTVKNDYNAASHKAMFIQLDKELDKIEKKYDCSPTCNVALMEDGTLTAGVDIRKMYVKDSTKKLSKIAKIFSLFKDADVKVGQTYKNDMGTIAKIDSFTSDKKFVNVKFIRKDGSEEINTMRTKDVDRLLRFNTYKPISE